MNNYGFVFMAVMASWRFKLVIQRARARAARIAAGAASHRFFRNRLRRAERGIHFRAEDRELLVQSRAVARRAFHFRRSAHENFKRLLAIPADVFEDWHVDFPVS